MAVSFGCVIDTNTYGICQDVERENVTEFAEAIGADGDLEEKQAYDERETISLTYVTDGTAGPTAGGTMTIDSNVYWVDSVKEVESNTDFKRFEITGHRSIANSIPT